MHAIALLPLLALAVRAQSSNTSIENTPIVLNALTDLDSLSSQYAKCVQPCFRELFRSWDNDVLKITGEKGEKIDWKAFCVSWAGPAIDDNSIRSAAQNQTWTDFRACGMKERECEGEEEPLEDDEAYEKYQGVLGGSLLKYCKDFHDVVGVPRGDGDKPKGNSTKPETPKPTAPESSGATRVGFAGLALAGVLGAVSLLI